MDTELSDEPHWLTPPIATLIVGCITVFISGLVSLTYTPMRSDIDRLDEKLEKLASDPSPKPETRVAVSNLERSIEHAEEHLKRVEDRVNTLHFFMMQKCSSPPIILQRDVLQKRDTVTPPFLK